MRDKELAIDWRKHICYSRQVKNVIRRCLAARYPDKEAEELWEKVQHQYAEFLKDLPFLGGGKNTHNATGGTYDCIAIFAYYEAVPDKPSADELYEMNNEVFLPPFRFLGKVMDGNRNFLLRLMNIAFQRTAAKDRKIRDICPDGYIMETEPFDKGNGIRYRFLRCPVAEFARRHGYMDLMPAFCNGDFPALGFLHTALIREHTCAEGSVCDYWIVGDKSPVAGRYRLIKDKKGFVVSRRKWF